MTEERAQRLQKIALEMSEITKEIGPRLIRLAHLRQEAQHIIGEAQDEASRAT